MFSSIIFTKRGKSSIAHSFIHTHGIKVNTHQFFEGRHIVTFSVVLLRPLLHCRMSLTILTLDSFKQLLEILGRMLRSRVGWRRSNILTLDSLEKFLKVLRRLLRS